jgi:hypothetical protein
MALNLAMAKDKKGNIADNDLKNVSVISLGPEELTVLI